MQLVITLYATIAARLAELTDPANADRGDSPVSTAVITAIIAAGAVAVATLIIAVANGWAARIPVGP